MEAKKVTIPRTGNTVFQITNPPNTGSNRASRYTPAFTMVAECRYALTGVGAAIAFGSQKWNGNWADFVAAPARINQKIAPAIGLDWTSAALFNQTCMDQLPVICESMIKPASMARPPPPVTSSACQAAALADGCSCSNPIKRNEEILVNSQKMNNNNPLSLTTTPSMADINNRIFA